MAMAMAKLAAQECGYTYRYYAALKANMYPSAASATVESDDSDDDGDGEIGSVSGVDARRLQH